MTPIVDGLESEYGDQVAFKRVNAIEGDGPAIMRGYRIQGHPTTLIFNKEGQETQRIIGPQPQEAVASALQQAIN